MGESMLLQDVTLLGPEGAGARCDVFIEHGKIAAIGTELVCAEGTHVLDCGGKILSLGFIDLCAELCDPGFVWREDLRSGSRAAAAGGFTTIVASPATAPVVDNASVAGDVVRRAAEAPGARLLQAASLTIGLKGKELAEVGLTLQAGCVALSDGNRPIADTLVLRRSLEYARPFGVPVFLRPSDPLLEKDGLMHEGAVSLRMGLRGLPAASEEIGIARAVALARITGAKIHLTHVTSARGVVLIRHARQRDGLNISFSVPARNLVLTDQSIEADGYNTSLRLNPPLRAEEDRAALRAAVRAGEASVVSDHCPWTRVEKEKEFAYCEPGAMGLESAFSATLTGLGGDLTALHSALIALPAKVLGLSDVLQVGAVADLVVFDPTAQAPLSGTRYSKGRNEPLRGQILKGQIFMTIVGGRIVHGPIAND